MANTWNGPSRNSVIPYLHIDKNMRPLVRVVNTLPGVKTVGCCGGHENRKRCQQPKGKWFLSIWVYKDGINSRLILKAFFKKAGIKFTEPCNESGKKLGWICLLSRTDPIKVAKQLKAWLYDKCIN